MRTRTTGNGTAMSAIIRALLLLGLLGYAAATGDNLGNVSSLWLLLLLNVQKFRQLCRVCDG